MKKISRYFNPTLISVFTLSLLMFFSARLNAQIPQDVPHPDDSEPLSFEDPVNVIVYIVLPLLLITFYLYLRRRKRRK